MVNPFKEYEECPAGKRGEPPLLELHCITKTFRVGDHSVCALQGIDLQVAPGEMVAIRGPSGSGKSTLLQILGCLDRPTGGTYQLNGRQIELLSDADLSRIRNHYIGFVFQSFHLIPTLTAIKNVELPLFYRGVDAVSRRQRALEVLDQVGLANRALHNPNQLSGGQRQRVAIARALVNRPSFLLADEPTGNLDSQTGAEVMAVFRELNRQGQTVILVTHDPMVAAQASRQVFLRDGRIASAPTELS